MVYPSMVEKTFLSFMLQCSISFPYSAVDKYFIVLIGTILLTVGPGGSRDENGETTIDALIMNGVTFSLCGHFWSSLMQLLRVMMLFT